MKPVLLAIVILLSCAQVSPQRPKRGPEPPKPRPGEVTTVTLPRGILDGTRFCVELDQAGQACTSVRVVRQFVLGLRRASLDVKEFQHP